MALLEVFVNVLSGSATTFTLLMQSTDTIESLKLDILNQEGIPVAKQRLIFDGCQLENELKIEDTDIHHQCTIFLEVCSQISVRLVTGEVYDLDVNLETDTVDHIKSMIAKIRGIPSHRQSLFYNNSGLRDNSLTLSRYNIVPDCILQLFLTSTCSLEDSFKIIIQSVNPRKAITLKLNLASSTLISDVKVAINAQDDIPVSEQCLVFNGTQLQDNFMLSAYKICCGDILHLLSPLRTSSVYIFLTDQKPHSNSKFVLGDRVILQPLQADVLSGKVKWVGQVPYGVNDVIAMVGIETDKKIKPEKYFPNLYMNIALSYSRELFKVGFNRGRLFLPEVLVNTADFYSEYQKTLQFDEIAAKHFGLTINEYYLQKKYLKDASDNASSSNKADVHVHVSSPLTASIGAAVCIPSDNYKPQLYGTVVWIGTVPDKQEIFAGVQLEHTFAGCTDGEWQGRKLFWCPPKTGYFCPVKHLCPDTRCKEDCERGEILIEKCFNPMSDLAPLTEEDHVKVTSDLFSNYVVKKGRGIQGSSYVSYFDALIFSVFSLSDTFDEFLFHHKADEEDQQQIIHDLHKGIINPLRKCGIARYESIVKVKTSLEDFIDEDMPATLNNFSPEMILKLLFGNVFNVSPFLTIQRSNTLHGHYFIQLEEKFYEGVCTTNNLLEQTFRYQELLLTNSPSKLFLVLPPFKKDTFCIPSLDVEVNHLFSYGKNSTSLRLLSVICRSSTNYVCYVRSENQWLYHDSMDSRCLYGKFHIPKCVDVSKDLQNDIYSEEEITNQSIKNYMSEYSRSFVQDAYMCIYVSTSKSEVEQATCTTSFEVEDDHTDSSSLNMNYEAEDTSTLTLTRTSLQSLLEEKNAKREFSLTDAILALQKANADHDWLSSSFDRLSQSYLELLDQLDKQKEESKQKEDHLQFVIDESVKTLRQNEDDYRKLQINHSKLEQDYCQLKETQDNLMASHQNLEEEHASFKSLHNNLFHEHEKQILEKDNKFTELQLIHDDLCLVHQKQSEEYFHLQNSYHQLQDNLTQTEEALQKSKDEVTDLQVKVTATEQSWQYKYNEIELTEEVLGKGGWGEVAIGKFREQKVAIKKIYEVIANDVNLKHMLHEINIMAQLRHPNLLQFIGAVLDHPSGNPMIITEVMDTSLRKAYEGKLITPDQQLVILSIMRDVAVGLNYLHCLPDPIIHRDVSSANVLLESKGHGQWKTKVSDFGSAKIARVAFTTAAGALTYSAPESLQTVAVNLRPKKQLTTKMDVFSYGVLLCEVIVCKFPYQETFIDLLQQVKTMSSHEMHDLVVACIMEEPEGRPSMKTVINIIDN